MVTESKFKVGDRVRRIGRPNNGASVSMHVGDKGTVSEVYSNGWIMVDGYKALREQDPSCFVFDSPVRTVTRREIVPGDHKLPREQGPTVRIGPVYNNAVGVATIAGFGQDHYGMFTVPDLRAAATLFNELADVLDENQREAA